MDGRPLRALGWKIWQSYLMPSRLSELADWYRASLKLGYKFYSLESYWRLTEGGRCSPPARSIVLRHDIDVDLAAARAVFDLEKESGIAGSYYFRLTTMDLPLIRAITEAGGEVGYHYEELADEAKACRLRSSAEVRERLPVIRQRFRDNLQRVRAVTGAPITTVAAHGDWVNRALGLPNTEILKCRDLRESAGILVEAYDDELLRLVTARYADAASPTCWVAKRVVAEPGHDRLEFSGDAPGTPMEAVRQGLPVLYVLLHPEQWKSGPMRHFRAHVKRFREAVTYRIRICAHSSCDPGRSLGKPGLGT